MKELNANKILGQHLSTCEFVCWHETVSSIWEVHDSVMIRDFLKENQACWSAQLNNQHH